MPRLDGIRITATGHQGTRCVRTGPQIAQSPERHHLVLLARTGLPRVKAQSGELDISVASPRIPAAIIGIEEPYYLRLLCFTQAAIPGAAATVGMMNVTAMAIGLTIGQR